MKLPLHRLKLLKYWQFYVGQPNTNRVCKAELWPCWKRLQAPCEALSQGRQHAPTFFPNGSLENSWLNPLAFFLNQTSLFPSHSFNKHMSSTHHRPGTVLELSSLLRSVFLSPVFSSVSVYLGPKHLLSKPHSPPLRPSFLPALTPTYPLLGLIPPKMPTHPHNLISLPLPLLPRNMPGLGSPRR